MLNIPEYKESAEHTIATFVQIMESTSGNPHDPEGGSDTPSDVDRTLFLSSDN